MEGYSTKFLIILCTVALVVIILANIELWINKRKSVIEVETKVDQTVLLPSETGHMDPVYLYNAKKVNKRDLDYRLGYNENKYVEKDVQEHVASKISTPLKEVGSTLKKIPKSDTPINSLYVALGKGGEVINNVDPLSYNNECDFKIITSARDNVEAFIAGNTIYVK